MAKLTTTALMHKILARGLPVFREAAMWPRLADLRYKDEAARKGEKISIPKSVSVDVEDVIPSNTVPAPTVVEPTEVTITMNNFRQNKGIVLDDEDMTNIDANEHFLPLELEEAFRAVANDIHSQIFTNYKKVWNVKSHNDAESSFSEPFSTDGSLANNHIAKKDASSPLRILSQQSPPAPKADRFGIVSETVAENMLTLGPFSEVQMIGTDRAVIEGELGRRYRANWFEDNAIPVHTAGSGAGTPLTNGVQAVGATSIVSDGWTASSTGVLLEGDLVQFAGTHDITGQHYVVRDVSVDSDGTGNATFTISPGLKAQVADGTAIQLVPDHTVNVVAHKRAFAFAPRKIKGGTSRTVGGDKLRDIQERVDPVTGVTLRLERIVIFRQEQWYVDALWGSEAIFPEYAVRLIGPP